MNHNVRERILDVASQLFLQYGHKRTTVEMIARGAGIAKGSLYLHFDGKDAVFAAASQRLCKTVLDDIGATAKSDLPVEEKLHKLSLDSSLYIWDFCHQAPHAPALWSEVVAAAGQYAVSAYDQAARIVADVITEGQGLGIFSQALDPQRAAGLLQIALQGFDVPYLLIENRRQIETQLPQLLEVFIKGLKHLPCASPRSSEYERR